MRRALGAVLAAAVVAGVLLFVQRPGPVDAQGGGTVEVTVTYNGAPVVEKLKVNKDTEKCGTEAVIEKVVVGSNKGLANAVVSVPSAKGAPRMAKVTVDQHGCKFVPHVTAMMPGELDLKNSDDILHNIHTYSTANPSINKAQPKFKKLMMEKFEKPEIIKLPATCTAGCSGGWRSCQPRSSPSRMPAAPRRSRAYRRASRRSRCGTRPSASRRRKSTSRRARWRRSALR